MHLLMLFVLLVRIVRKRLAKLTIRLDLWRNRGGGQNATVHLHSIDHTRIPAHRLLRLRLSHIHRLRRIL